MTMPLISIVMGSQSDYQIMKYSEEMLDILHISYRTYIVSAHRTPNRLYRFAQQSAQDNIELIIAGAGGAAHLPGMIASLTTIPVLGVPINSASLQGLDSLLSIVQMPAGIPVGTLSIGMAGAKNAAILSAQILGNKYPEIQKRIEKWRAHQTDNVPEYPKEDYV
ncbi:MAG: phosphoribosylaminoimidazole carboxylase, catalytic subunit PurE [Candidatus Xenolissoclinum pacificiensis L6]|uniref:N5-carboxyaminoimidazole ribonucleotide mutase n=1 Tax=Candidatus Xenolissoclinum pacificiensis L6 TaxID=1401685 RepID=W2V088_9RICK|nr:MAG: phosphoribosylaminoimidazole carboxylase, catalytic subunit PurE [Candidatus Xenolissoclinum pacificiensis L6]